MRTAARISQRTAARPRPAPAGTSPRTAARPRLTPAGIGPHTAARISLCTAAWPPFCSGSAASNVVPVRWRVDLPLPLRALRRPCRRSAPALRRRLLSWHRSASVCRYCCARSSNPAAVPLRMCPLGVWLPSGFNTPSQRGACHCHGDSPSLLPLFPTNSLNIHMKFLQIVCPVSLAISAFSVPARI